MSFGEDYAKAYDAFYRTKDYPAETHFVLERLKTVLGDRPLSILDLGCGTGLHDVAFVQNGHRVTGVDMSPGMLAKADERRRSLFECWQDELKFVRGDVRTFRAGKTYDAVISLFHVMSYMAGDDNFAAALETARAHLKPGGALLFDFWFGPAVVSDPPQRREREVEEAGKRIKRVTTPHWDRTRDTVRIVFDVTETDTATGAAQAMSEEHVLRYFFDDGLRKTLGAAGFEIIELGEWLTGRRPDEGSFAVYSFARAV